MAERKKLADILLNSGRERLVRSWDTTEPAADLKPIPSGEYRCRVVNGELFNSKNGTPGYKLTLEVLDGDHAGRRVWHDVWLSDAALSLARRDLNKLGIVRPEQLEQPLPGVIVIVARVALRRRDDGAEYNAVVRFDVVAVEPPTLDTFAPAEPEPPAAEAGASDAEGFDWQSGEQTRRNGVPTP
jgi:hypothetical protein